MNSTQLANRLGEVILNGRWIANTNIKDQIENLDYTIANKQVKSLNTIAILTQHIHYYVSGIKNVFISGNLEIRDKFSFDFPPITSQKQWKSFQNLFWKDTEELIQHISDLSDSELKNPFVDKKYGNYQRNIDGLIEHAYYHLGQIVLIKKMIESSYIT
ncbi:DUF1572 family protein [Winogradskyella marincola]|uniref:DUF1572 family protein n=1 Tax=Winogradskyella marincola TaxID=3037795 RepID=A0ABT6G560_9FLAO|nr:DUF1572 family protein [Winogradskyella sp. YYF002]MDG4717175.1 DUF1572 family protein [Winogradskyella sp. YYF002]